MSLLEDSETADRHRANGTLTQHLAGTAPILDTEGNVVATPVLDEHGQVLRYEWLR